MKIELEYPYSTHYFAGYLFTNSQNRKHVLLTRFDRTRTSTAYARYLLAVKLGRFLTDDETADHIDENKTNDSLDNLQILSRSENTAKNNRHLKKEQIFKIRICPSCDNEFEVNWNKIRDYSNKNKTLTCSRSCSLRLLVSKPKISADVISEIKYLHNEYRLSSYKIAEILKINRNTVMKYW